MNTYKEKNAELTKEERRQITVDFMTNLYFDSELSERNKNSVIKREMFEMMITTHGAGGKLVEQLVQNKFGIDEDEDAIHGYDGITKNTRRPVEMKMETVCASDKLNAKGSWGTNRKTSGAPLHGDKYKKDRPYIINIGTCNETGKCIYVLCIDTAKMPEDAILFERLNAKDPRISFSHYAEYPEAYNIIFCNTSVFNELNAKGGFRKNFADEIIRMNTKEECLDTLMGNSTKRRKVKSTKTSTVSGNDISDLPEASQYILENYNKVDKIDIVNALNSKGLTTSLGNVWTTRRLYSTFGTTLKKYRTA